MAKVVLVDGSSIARFFLRNCLKRLGHEVVGEATNCQDTLRLYAELRPDVVLVDVCLPDDNGLTVLRCLVNMDKHANVVMCSTTALRNIIIEAHQLGAKHFLVKPFSDKILDSTIQRLVNNRLNIQNFIKLKNYIKYQQLKLAEKNQISFAKSN